MYSLWFLGVEVGYEVGEVVLLSELRFSFLKDVACVLHRIRSEVGCLHADADNTLFFIFQYVYLELP